MKEKLPIFKRVVFEIMLIPSIMLILVGGIIFLTAFGVCYIFSYPVEKWFSTEDRSKIVNSSYAFKILIKARDFFSKVISK